MKRKLCKIVSVITLAVMCLSITVVPVGAAAYYGDIDMDGNVSASDARKVLRHSAKIQLLDDSLFARADVNLDKKITASDARLILRVAAKLDEFEEYEDSVIDRIELDEYDGIRSNKLPYEIKGLEIESISYNEKDHEIQLAVRNKTGYAVENSSYIYYKCYDATNVFIDDGYVSVRNMNSNEACLRTASIHKDTAKIVFYDADVVKCEYVPSYEMQEVDGMQVSKMPLNLDGIVLRSISFDKKYEKAQLVVSNQTGMPIASTSTVSVKTYNADGYIIDSKDVSLKEMNNNESALVDFYYGEGVTKFVFYASVVRKSDSLYQGEMIDIDGLSINALPYSSNGLSVENAVYDAKSRLLRVTFKNENSFAISDYSYMEYKAYNAENFVIRSSNYSPTHLNSNEMCIREYYLPEGTTKVVFGKAGIRETETLKPDSLGVYESIEMNTLPCVTDGFRIEEVVSVDKYGAMTLKIRNVTGSAIKSGAWINYKCYNSDGVIVKAGSMSLVTLNNNEAQLYSVTLHKDTARVVFLNASSKTGEDKKDFAVSAVNGILFNRYPVTINGITIESIRTDEKSKTFYLTVVNNTGENLKDTTYITYCCYDKDGNVVKEGSRYIDRLNKYEETEVAIYYTETTEKMVVYDAKIYVAEA